MASFKERMKQKREQLLEREKEQVDDKDSYGKNAYGSIFLKDKIPEGIEFWKPEFGPHNIDILSFECGPDHPKQSEGQISYLVDIWVYMNVGAGGDTFVSPTSTWGERDPIAEYIKKTQLDKKQFGKLRAKRRTIYLIWCHDSPEEEEKGVQLWEVAHFFFEDHIDELNKANPKGQGASAFSDLFTGKRIAFNINKTGSEVNPDTGKPRDNIAYIGHQFVDREDPEIPDNIADQIFPLDSIIDMHPSYEKIYESFYGAPYDSDASPNTVQPTVPVTKSPPATEVDPNTCPYGYELGVNTDEHPECGPCENWDDCNDKKLQSQAADTPAEETTEDPAAETEQSAEETPVEDPPPKKKSNIVKPDADTKEKAKTTGSRRKRRGSK